MDAFKKQRLLDKHAEKMQNNGHTLMLFLLVRSFLSLLIKKNIIYI